MTPLNLTTVPGIRIARAGRLRFWACFWAGLILVTSSQIPLAGAASVESRLKAAAAESSGLIEIDRWIEDSDGRAIWRARIGSGGPENGAVLLVAGLDGRHAIGVELALRHVELIAADSGAFRDLLRERTLYVVPEMVPMGRDARDDTPSRSRATAPGSSDSDRDGLRGEDLCDDLDGDGVIRQVRVSDPDGEFALSTSLSGLLHKANAVEDEVGLWRLLTEGRDDDGDENWNEEEDGGVWLARNFPHGYEWFARGRGAHQVSERETRAIGDFLGAHPEVGAVWVYGFEDNLLTPLAESQSSDPPLSGSRFGRDPITKPNKADLPWLRELSTRYRTTLAVPEKASDLGFGDEQIWAENEVAIPSAKDAAKGGLAQYVYFHRGRLALATPGWTPALQLSWNAAAQAEAESETPDEGTEDTDGEEGDVVDADAPDDTGDTGEVDDTDEVGDESDAESEVDLNEQIQAEEEFLAWLLEKDPAAWKPWTSIDHPDFPGEEAFVGGYLPGSRVNPPASEVDSLAARHHRVLLELFDLLPRVRLREVDLVSKGRDVFELRFVVENIGWLPDVLAQGAYSAVVRPTRFELELPRDGEVLGAPSRAPLGRIEGRGGAVERTVLLRLPESGKVTIRIVSEFAGRDEHVSRPGDHWRVGS